MSEFNTSDQSGNLPASAEAEIEAGLKERFEQLSLPSGFNRRRFTGSDVELFLNFDNWSFFISETPEDHQPEKFTPQDYLEGIDKGDIIDGIFDEEGNIIAVMWLEEQAENDSIDIYNLDVHPDHRQRKIGSYFLDSAEAIAKIKGYKNLSLHVDPLNAVAMRMYMNRGFLIEGYEFENRLGLKDWLIMLKKLTHDDQPDYTDVIELLSGDESGLEAAIKNGFTGIEYKLSDESQDPARQTIVFAKT